MLSHLPNCGNLCIAIVGICSAKSLHVQCLYHACHAHCWSYVFVLHLAAYKTQQDSDLCTCGTLDRPIRCSFAKSQLSAVGVPARVRTHEVTKQVEYIGDVQNLVEKLSDLPAGGQILMGPLTYQRIYGRLEEFRIHSLQLAYEQPSRAPGHSRGVRARRRMSGALSSMCKAVKVLGQTGSASFTSRKTSASSMHDADLHNRYEHHTEIEVNCCEAPNSFAVLMSLPSAGTTCLLVQSIAAAYDIVSSCTHDHLLPTTSPACYFTTQLSSLHGAGSHAGAHQRDRAFAVHHHEQRGSAWHATPP